MRNLMIKFVVVMAVAAVAVGFATSPALAGGDGSFNPDDGRNNPNLTDRIAVYCRTDGVEVWGLDNMDNGVYLTTFSASEVASASAITHKTAEGDISLQLVKPARTMFAYKDYDATEYSEFVEEGASYTVSWKGGNYGANGSGPFSKVIDCTYTK